MYKIIIVIDMQKDFISGTLGTPQAAAIVSNIAKKIEASENQLIIFTQDTHQEDYLQTPEGKKLPVIHCIENTPGWEIDPTIKNAWKNNKNTIILEEVEENTFKKPVFASLQLIEFLQKKEPEISEIEMVGVCTDICVISNALMIKNILPNVKVSVNGGLCAGVTEESHDQALNVMKMCHVDII